MHGLCYDLCLHLIGWFDLKLAINAHYVLARYLKDTPSAVWLRIECGMEY